MKFRALALPKAKNRPAYASEGLGEAGQSFDSRADLISLIYCFHEGDFAVQG